MPARKKIRTGIKAVPAGKRIKFRIKTKLTAPAEKKIKTARRRTKKRAFPGREKKVKRRRRRVTARPVKETKAPNRPCVKPLRKSPRKKRMGPKTGKKRVNRGRCSRKKRCPRTGD